MNAPEDSTKLTLGVIVPDVIVKVPLTVNVVHIIVGTFNIVPAVYVNVLEQVKLNDAKSNVPAVIAKVLQLKAADKVVVPAPLLIITGPNVVFPLALIVPVPTIVAVKVLNVPPDESVNPFKFNEVVPGLNAVVPKFNVLNQLAVVNVTTAVPEPVKDKFGAFVLVPPVVPNVTVLVMLASVVKPPVPVSVKPVAVAIDNTVVAAVV